MRCEECRRQVEDYFDRELDEQTTDLVRNHLSVCAPCAAAYRALEQEQELYLLYECDAEPQPAFWDEVMARATEQTTARPAALISRIGRSLAGFNALRLSPSLTALLLLAAIGITALVASRVNRRTETFATARETQGASGQSAASGAQEKPTEIAAVSTNSSVNEGKGEKAIEQEGMAGGARPEHIKREMKSAVLPAVSKAEGARSGRRYLAEWHEPTSDELVREAEQKYIAAIDVLSRDAARRHSRLDSETSARFERALAAIDRTIQDTRRAVREHPGDPQAAQYMLAAYSKKVDALREMIGY